MPGKQFCKNCTKFEKCDLDPVNIGGFRKCYFKDIIQKEKKPKKGLRKVSKDENISTLKTKLWLVFRDYICFRDDWKCTTCPHVGEPENRFATHCGHYISKSSYDVLKFDERNNNAQCSHCNEKTNDRGNSWYSTKMVRKYGEEVQAELAYAAFWKQSYETVYGFAETKEVIKDKIAYYKIKLAEERERYYREAF